MFVPREYPSAGTEMKFSNSFGSILVFIFSSNVLHAYYYTLGDLIPAKYLIRSICVGILVVMYILLLWSVLAMRFKFPPEIPAKFSLKEDELSFILANLEDIHLIQEELQEMANERGVRTKSHRGQVNICRSCRIVKPERAHHCKICKTCVLRMDHHCWFFGICIHFGNYKYFLLTLFYVQTGLFFVLITNLTFYFFMSHAMTSIHYATSFAFARFMMLNAFSLVAFLFIGCFYFVAMDNAFTNLTTLEELAKMRGNNPYDLKSRKTNFKQTFGANQFLWPFPVFTTPGDGTSFPFYTDLREPSEIALEDMEPN